MKMKTLYESSKVSKEQYDWYVNYENQHKQSLTCSTCVKLKQQIHAIKKQKSAADKRYRDNNKKETTDERQHRFTFLTCFIFHYFKLVIICKIFEWLTNTLQPVFPVTYFFDMNNFTTILCTILISYAMMT